MAVSYATREDVYRLAAPRGSLTLPARQVASADPTTDRLELDGHGFADGTALQFRAEADGELPAGISAGTVYYAKAVADSDSLFQVSATDGGAAVNLTTEGTAPFSVFTPIAPMIDAEIEHHSRWVDSALASHGVPFEEPYPVVVVAAVAKRALASVVRTLGLGGFDDIVAEAASVTADVLRMGKSGISLRDADATATTIRATARSGLSTSGSASTRTLP